MELADPFYFQSGKNDLLLDCNVYQDLLFSGIAKGDQRQPIAQETIFGWAIIRWYNLDNSPHVSTESSIYHINTSPSSDDLFQLFWNIEEVPRNLPSLTQDEQAVVDHFFECYKVTLIRKPDAPNLGNSRAHTTLLYI